MIQSDVLRNMGSHAARSGPTIVALAVFGLLIGGSSLGLPGQAHDVGFTVERAAGLQTHLQTSSTAEHLRPAGQSIRGDSAMGRNSGRGSNGAKSGVTSSTPSPQVGQVARTLDLLNGTDLTGNPVVANGLNPDAAALDPSTGEIYVTDNGGSSLSILNATRLVSSYAEAFGSGPDAIAFDSSSDRMFVANFGSSTVTVINGTSGKVLAPVNLSKITAGPNAIAVDPISDRVFVTSYYWNLVTVLNGSTGKVIGSKPTGMTPVGLAFDSANGAVYVATSGSRNLTILNGTTGVGLGSISLTPVTPNGIAYDAANGDIYVSGFLSQNLTIVDPRTSSVVGNVSTGKDPSNIVYDGQVGELFVDALGSGDISVVDAVNNTQLPSIHIGSYGSDPVAGAADYLNGDVYETDVALNLVAVINATTGRVLAHVILGETPASVAVDPSTGYLYVPEYYSENLSVVNSTTGGFVASVETGLYSQFAAFDLDNGLVYDSLSYDIPYGQYTYAAIPSSIAVVNTSNNSVLTSIDVGSSPGLAALDMTNGELYVPNNGADNVSVVSGVTNSVVGGFSTVTQPTAAAFDAAADEVWVTSWGDADIAIYYASNYTPVKTIGTGGEPVSMAYDSLNDELYVANSAQDTVTIYDGVTDQQLGSVRVGADPNFVTIDGADDYVYVANTGSNNLSVISGWSNQLIGSIGTGAGPDAIAWDNSTRDLLVSNFESGTISVVTVPSLPVYNITLTETGLPNGTGWSFTLDATPTQASPVPSIAITLPNGTYDYVASPSDANYDSVRGNFSVSGANVSIQIRFSQVLYSVTFTEAGLPTGTEWWVNLTGQGETNSTGRSLIVEVPNGSYAFQAGSRNQSYDATGGMILVNGSSKTRTVSFHLVTFSVEFAELGLPDGTVWSVTLGSSQQNSSSAEIMFTAPNGTERYQISTVSGWVQSTLPYVGEITVDGQPLDEPTLVFRQASYRVTISELGLPTGTGWWVNLSGENSLHSVTTNLSFSEPNSSVNYVIASDDKTFHPIIPSGSFVINGGPLEVSVRFAITNYSVEFAETGLSTAAEWWLNVSGGTSIVTASGNLSLNESNGTYRYSVASPNAIGESGSFTVAGSSPPTVEVKFTYPAPITPTPTPPPPTHGAESPPLPLIPIGIGIAVAAVAATALLAWRRKRQTR